MDQVEARDDHERCAEVLDLEHEKPRHGRTSTDRQIDGREAHEHVSENPHHTR